MSIPSALPSCSLRAEPDSAISRDRSTRFIKKRVFVDDLEVTTTSSSSSWSCSDDVLIVVGAFGGGTRHARRWGHRRYNKSP